MLPFTRYQKRRRMTEAEITAMRMLIRRIAIARETAPSLSDLFALLAPNDWARSESPAPQKAQPQPVMPSQVPNTGAIQWSD
jgi:hypothetical protein